MIQLTVASHAHSTVGSWWSCGNSKPVDNKKRVKNAVNSVSEGSISVRLLHCCLSCHTTHARDNLGERSRRVSLPSSMATYRDARCDDAEFIIARRRRCRRARKHAAMIMTRFRPRLTALCERTHWCSHRLLLGWRSAHRCNYDIAQRSSVHTVAKSNGGGYYSQMHTQHIW